MPNPRKPRALDVIDGGRSKTRKREGQFVGEVTPLAPELSSLADDRERAAAAAIQSRLVLSGVGLAESHVFGIELLAALWVEIQDSRAQLAAEGVTVDGGREGRKRHPALAQLREARKQFLALAVRFGLSPYDWERIDTELTPGRRGDMVGETDDSLEALLQ